MKKLSLLSIVMIQALAVTVGAYENRCHTRFEGSVPSVCKNRMLPTSKTRNFRRDTQMLVCSSGVDHYFRSQQKFDFEKWSMFLKAQDFGQAQNFRKADPEIKWAGQIPYQTVEVWDWQSCDLVTSSFDCGTHTEYHDEQRSRQRCSGSGQKQTCNTEYYTVRVSTQEPNTCWSDRTHSETWTCSNEKMTFDAQYQKPDYNSWKPGTPGYIDALPNKYDLLPGEIEDVQLFSNSRASQVIQPNAEVGDAWNKYSYSITGSAVGARCEQEANLHLDVAVITQERNKGKKTPMAFKLPHDANGNPVEPIKWGIKNDVNGKVIEKGIPIALRLADTSSGIMTALAEVSKTAADRETQKQSVGQGSTPNQMTPADQSKAGFFKNTKIRVELVKDNEHLFDNHQFAMGRLSDGEGVVPSTNFLAEDQEIAFSDIWEIPMRNLKSGDAGLYKSWLFKRDKQLKPGQKYHVEVSMYQKGAKGLYLQDCDEDPSFWACKFRWIGLGRTEDKIYSDPIKIQFQEDANMKDERSTFDKVADWFF